MTIKQITWDASESQDQAIELETGTEVSGTVTNETGEPVAYALIQIYSLDNTLLGTAISDSDGDYSISIATEDL